MDINHTFLELALLGSSWVLWLMVGLSVLALSVAIERSLKYRRAAAGQTELRQRALTAWSARQLDKPDLDALDDLMRSASALDGPASAMLAAVHEGRKSAQAASERVVAATRSQEQRRLERSLNVLGTVGANAPFIGLFGTVLEILRVFSLVGAEGMAGSEQSLAIMSGISEALVATGVGLLVAIPAVVGFNALGRWVETIMAEADEVVQLALALASQEAR